MALQSTDLFVVQSQTDKKTLLIDADPQGNASTGMGISYENRNPNLYNLIVNIIKDISNTLISFFIIFIMFFWCSTCNITI